LVAVALLGLAGEASAQPAPPSLLPRVELDYQVAPGLDCPTLEDVQAEVVKEIEGDPFSATGPLIGRFHVVVSPQGTEGIEIVVKFADVTGRRTFDTPFKGSPRTARTCSHLVRTHAIGEIVMEVIFQMSRRYRTILASGGSSCITPAACAASRYDIWPDDWTLKLLPKPAPKPDPPPLPERWPTAFRLAVAAGPEAVASGWGSVGLTAEVGFRYRSFSLGVEVHGDPPMGSYLAADRSVTFGRVTGAMLACYHLGLFVGCAVGDAGGILFPNRAFALPPAMFYSDVGVRVGLEFPIAPPRVFLKVAANVMAPINPQQFVFMQTSVFQVAGPSAGLLFGPVLELPW
jgi:hypothetical protein